MKGETIIIGFLLIAFLIMGFKYYFLKVKYKNATWYRNLYESQYKQLHDEKARKS